jgi:hypothetical protein
MDMMRSRGWLHSNGRQASAEFARFDDPENPNNDLAYMFEWLIDQRHDEALDAFSVGPTQNYLYYANVTHGRLAYLYPDLEALFDFYVASDVAPSWNTGSFNRLGAAPYLHLGMTACREAAGGNCVESWLQNHQTGQLPWSEQRWADYADRFLRNVRSAYQAYQRVLERTGA